jgi:gas vesicle protein
MSSKDTRIGFAIGFFVGAAIGVAIGFLYAPRPVVEARKQIKEKAEEVKDKAIGVVDKLQESAAKARYRKRWAEQGE